MSGVQRNGSAAGPPSGRPGWPGRSLVRSLAYQAAGMCLRATGGRVRNDVGRELFVDRADRRARQVLLRRGAVDRTAIRLWRAAVGALAPTVALDVGANYGEVALCTDYPAGCRVLCVEANHRVGGYLARSLTMLPGAELTVAAAGARPDLPCFLRPGRTSGEGRVVAGRRAGSPELRTVTCDELVGDGTGHRLVFKIDVEGDEAAVLTGLRGTLGAATAACWIVEFFHLDRGEQRGLIDRYPVYAATSDATVLHRLTLDRLPVLFPAPHRVRPGYAKDVVLVTGTALPRLVGAGLRVGDR